MPGGGRGARCGRAERPPLRVASPSRAHGARGGSGALAPPGDWPAHGDRHRRHRGRRSRRARRRVPDHDRRHRRTSIPRVRHGGRRGGASLSQGPRDGLAQGHGEDGHLLRDELSRSRGARGAGARRRGDGALLPGRALAHRWSGPGRPRTPGAHTTRGHARPRTHAIPQGGRTPRLQPPRGARGAEGRANRRRGGLPRVAAAVQHGRAAVAARAHDHQGMYPAGSSRRGGIGDTHRQALCQHRDVVGRAVP